MASCLIEVAQFVNVSNEQIKNSRDLYNNTMLNQNDLILKTEDFLLWCQKDNLIIEFLDLVFQSCHIVLGLRPSSQQDELIIVRYDIELKNISIDVFFFLQLKKFPST